MRVLLGGGGGDDASWLGVLVVCLARAPGWMGIASLEGVSSGAFPSPCGRRWKALGL